MKPAPKPARPADRLPEPYRSLLLSCINSVAMDGMPVSEDIEEGQVQRMEHDLANGGRERRRREVEALDEARKLSKLQLPLVRVANPLPRW